jgi:hypothetical protein
MWRSPFVLLVAAGLLAGCSSTGTSQAGPSPSTVSDARSGVAAGYSPDVDVLSPLLITALAPDPIPVTGTDGKAHVAYENAVRT